MFEPNAIDDAFHSIADMAIVTNDASASVIHVFSGFEDFHDFVSRCSAVAVSARMGDEVLYVDGGQPKRLADSIGKHILGCFVR